MKLKEYKEIYHPSLGKFVLKHRGSGLIVDNIFKRRGSGLFADNILKPMKMIMDKVLKPVAEKALKSGIESAGDKLGKKVVEKSGHFLTKEIKKLPLPNKKGKKLDALVPQKQEDYNVLLNRMISGEGYKKQKNKKKFQAYNKR